MQAIEPGNVVRVHRGLYDHYAVYLGEELVLQLGGAGLKDKAAASIHYAPFADFAKQDAFGVVDLPGQDLAATVERAIWLCENPPPVNYHLLAHNCEHVARWCATGTAESHQVRDALRVNAAFSVGGVFAVANRPDSLWALIGTVALLLLGLIAKWFSDRDARRFAKYIHENYPGSA
jgi:hypothetical protein